jgi:hypothetical protein
VAANEEANRRSLGSIGLVGRSTGGRTDRIGTFGRRIKNKFQWHCFCASITSQLGEREDHDSTSIFRVDTVDEHPAEGRAEVRTDHI